MGIRTTVTLIQAEQQGRPAAYEFYIDRRWWRYPIWWFYDPCSSLPRKGPGSHQFRYVNWLSRPFTCGFNRKGRLAENQICPVGWCISSYAAKNSLGLEISVAFFSDLQWTETMHGIWHPSFYRSLLKSTHKKKEKKILPERELNWLQTAGIAPSNIQWRQWWLEWRWFGRSGTTRWPTGQAVASNVNVQ